MKLAKKYNDVDVRCKKLKLILMKTKKELAESKSNVFTNIYVYFIYYFVLKYFSIISYWIVRKCKYLRKRKRLRASYRPTHVQQKIGKLLFMHLINDFFLPYDEHELIYTFNILYIFYYLLNHHKLLISAYSFQ